HTRSYGDWSSDVCSSDLVDECAEVVLVRQLECGVVLVDPLDQHLQRPADVETGGAGVGVDGRLGLRRRLVDGGPLRSEEGEVRRSEERRVGKEGRWGWWR